MTRTPDEIKKGLEITSNDCLMCACCITDCPYDLECHPGNEETNTNVPKAMLRDALVLIQQLQAENAKQTDRIHQLEAERDAAVEDMTKIVQESSESYCEYCHNWRGNTCPPYCRTHSEGFRWRGVQKEERQW